MISDLLKVIKPYVIHFLDSSAVVFYQTFIDYNIDGKPIKYSIIKLKLWIQILMPQIEDFKAELSLQIQVRNLNNLSESSK